MPHRSAARAVALALLVAVVGGIPLHSEDAAAAAGPAPPGAASQAVFPTEGQSAASGLAARRGGGGHLPSGDFSAAAGVDWMAMMKRLLHWRRSGIQPGPEWDFVPKLVQNPRPPPSFLPPLSPSLSFPFARSLPPLTHPPTHPLLPTAAVTRSRATTFNRLP